MKSLRKSKTSQFFIILLLFFMAIAIFAVSISIQNQNVTNSKAAGTVEFTTIEPDSLSSSQKNRFDRMTNLSFYSKTAILQTTNISALKSADEIKLPLFEQGTVTFKKRGLKTYQNGANVWKSNKVYKGIKLITNISIKDNFIFGSIQTENGSYSLITVGGNKLMLAKHDFSKFVSKNDVQENVELSEVSGNGAIFGKKVRVLVAYTNGFATNLGGEAAVQSVIAQEIENNNDILKNSASGVELVLAGTIEIEDGPNVIYCSGQELQRLRENGDGLYDSVHAKRDAVNADIVHGLFYSTDTTCPYGTALMTYAWEPGLAFAITYQRGLGPNFTFAHENGHLLGASHHDPALNENWIFPYGYAYLNQNQQMRTVMVPSNICPTCLKIPYFSNPNLNVNGVSIGDSISRNNTLAIKVATGQTDDFRCSLPPQTGNCKAKFTRYYYDQAAAGCKEFVWGGCGGTVPFTGLSICQMLCQ